jgi:hypothetical protein
VAPHLGVPELRWLSRRPPTPAHPDFGEDALAANPAAIRHAEGDPAAPDGADLAMDFASMDSIVPRMREAFFAQSPHRSH